MSDIKLDDASTVKSVSPLQTTDDRPKTLIDVMEVLMRLAVKTEDSMRDRSKEMAEENKQIEVLLSQVEQLQVLKDQSVNELGPNTKNIDGEIELVVTQGSSLKEMVDAYNADLEEGVPEIASDGALSANELSLLENHMVNELTTLQSSLDNETAMKLQEAVNIYKAIFEAVTQTLKALTNSISPSTRPG